jgi:hypothetical protein
MTSVTYSLDRCVLAVSGKNCVMKPTDAREYCQLFWLLVPARGGFWLKAEG